MNKKILTFNSMMLGAVALFGVSANVQAVDGVVLIDQNRVMAGNVTLGDLPGFPVTITKSGSCRLSGNIVVPDFMTVGIRLNAPDITLDLNGFELLGPGNCDIGGGGDCNLYLGSGIASVGQSVITNGAIRNM